MRSMSDPLDLSNATWLHPIRVSRKPGWTCSPASPDTIIIMLFPGNFLLPDPSLPLASLSQSPGADSSALRFHLHHPVPLYVPAASRIPGHLSGLGCLGQRLVPGFRRRGGSGWRALRSILRGRDLGRCLRRCPPE